ncbi:TetR family transcriptional regulator [Streptomyces sp. IMTB 2501]|uniref:TetR family transcriptional regulator n=1 Tax=Streptomyces sp. IMTB 2501 TaxID=1776340 RepID=UPI0021160783|nr:TetR family transcriptional regulator [Streptomyces sp. IMTB 2501]
MARDHVGEGTPLQLNDIARRAHLGVGTVCRHFPAAEALLETVATPTMEASPPRASRRRPTTTPAAPWPAP